MSEPARIEDCVGFGIGVEGGYTFSNHLYLGANLTYFEVWAYQVPRGKVGVGDPLDLSQRLDNQWAVQSDPKA